MCQRDGRTAPRNQQYICDRKLGTDKCDNSLQMGCMQDMDQTGQVLAWARRYTTPSTAHKAQWPMGSQGQLATAQAQGKPWRTLLLPPKGDRLLWPSLQGVSPHRHSIWDFRFFCVFILFFYMFKCFQLRVCEGQTKMHVGWGSLPGPIQLANLPADFQSCCGEQKKPVRAGKLPQLILSVFLFLC